MKKKPAARPKTPPPPTSSIAPPDPIDVITQHWADLTGLSRPMAAAKLAQIGHCTMKENRAGVSTFRKELEDLVDAKAREDASAGGAQ